MQSGRDGLAAECVCGILTQVAQGWNRNKSTLTAGSAPPVLRCHCGPLSLSLAWLQPRQRPSCSSNAPGLYSPPGPSQVLSPLLATLFPVHLSGSFSAEGHRTPAPGILGYNAPLLCYKSLPTHHFFIVCLPAECKHREGRA